MAHSNERSPWFYVGCGCALLAFLIVAVVAITGYVGFRELRDFQAVMEDPVARNERALTMLGADVMPESYNAQLFFSVPFVMEVVLLSDGEQIVEDQSTVDLDDHDNAFFYLKLRNFDNNQLQLNRYLDGETDGTDFFGDLDFDLRGGETIGRGTFALDDAQNVRYVIERGEAKLGNHGNWVDGVFAFASTVCPGDDKLRVSVWFQRGPGSDTEDVAEDAISANAAPATAAADTTTGARPIEAVGLHGTPAIESDLRAFLGHFQICN